MTIPSNVSQGEEATIEWANAVLQTLRDLDGRNSVTSVTRSGNELVITQRNGTVTRVDIPSNLPEHDQTDREFLAGSRGVLSFEPINEVPDTPGTSSTIGHALTVIGENDGDYAWREVPDPLPEHNQVDREFLAGSRGVVSFEPINEVPDTPGTAGAIGHVLAVSGENDQDYHWSGALGTEIEQLGNWEFSVIATTANFSTVADARASSASPHISVVSEDISGTYSGRSYTYQTADVLFFAPRMVVPTVMFNLATYASGSGTTGGLTRSQVLALISTWARAGNTDRLPESKITQAVLDRINTNYNNSQIIEANLTRATSTLDDLVTEVDTLHPKIGRLVPINPWIRNDDAHVQLFAWFPLVAVARGAQLTVVVGGVTVRIQAPEAYAATDVDGLILSVAIDASNSATITRSANTVAGHVRTDLSMGDNDFHCYIPAEAPAATGGSGTTARTTVLKAIGSSTTSVTLPTDYAGYSLLEVEAAQSSGGTGTLIVPAGLLAGLSTATWTYASTQNGQSGVLSWNRSTRVLSGDSSNSINYAALTDGGPKGDKGDKGDRGDAGGLSTSQVDARIQTWGRAGNTSTIPDNKIPSSIARDSEVTSAVAGHLRFVEYSSESDVPNPVPAGTIAWVGETR